MLNNNTETKRTFLNIRHGKLYRYGDNAEFTDISGKLTDIRKADRTFNGETVAFWYLNIEDKKEMFSLSFPYSSGTFKAVINSLANASRLDDIRIHFYEKDGYTKAVTYAGEVKLDWKYNDIPPLEEIDTGGKKIKDDSKRMTFFENIAKEVRSRLEYPQQKREQLDNFTFPY